MVVVPECMHACAHTCAAIDIPHAYTLLDLFMVQATYKLTIHFVVTDGELSLPSIGEKTLQ